MGYAGGSTADHPTYTRIGDHIETLEVEFDPQRVSYQELLQAFAEGHDPTRRPWSRQYKSALMPLGESQLREARALVEDLARETGETIHTLIIPDAQFFPAEDYHQKYYLQSHPQLYQEVRKSYPSFQEMIDSGRVARINGYLGGFGQPVQLEEEASDLGLSPGALEALREVVRQLTLR